MSTRERYALVAIVAIALIVRIAFVLGQRSDVLFDAPQLDEGRYVAEARSLVDGTPNEQDALPYWQPPGLTYVLYATMKVAGPGLLAPRLVSAIVSAASCLLLFALARRLAGTRVALAAAAILALHGVVVFEASALLPATFALALDLAALLLLVIARDREERAWRFAAGAGLALGASALFAATVLPFAAVGVIALWKRRWRPLAAFVVGVVLPIAPITARNYVRAGEPVLVSANAGLNFYLGNNADYRATFSLRPGRHWSELVTEPERTGAAKAGTAGASSYFFGKGLGFYREDPVGAAGLLARKAYLFLHGAEIARDSDVYAARGDSVVLSALVWPAPVHVPDGLLVPLALVGIVALWPERRRLAIPLAFLGLQLVFVSLFFVTARYRLPSIPVLALFAAAGIPRLVREVRARSRFGLACVALFAGLVVACNWPAWETRLSLAAERELNRGLAYQARHDLPAAAGSFHRATQLDPNDAAAWFELGNSFDAIGRGPEAVEAWRRAAELDPWDSRARRREAMGRSRMGDIDGAIAALEALIASGAREPGHYAPDHLNLAFTLVRRGSDEARAIAHLRAAAADREYLRGALPRMTALAEIRSIPFLRALADIAGATNLPDLAAAAGARASELAPR